jgi:hypothetical protein
VSSDNRRDDERVAQLQRAIVPNARASLPAARRLRRPPRSEIWGAADWRARHRFSESSRRAGVAPGTAARVRRRPCVVGLFRAMLDLSCATRRWGNFTAGADRRIGRRRRPSRDACRRPDGIRQARPAVSAPACRRRANLLARFPRTDVNMAVRAQMSLDRRQAFLMRPPLHLTRGNADQLGASFLRLGIARLRKAT